MNVVVNQITWHGHDAFALESDTLRTVVVPELGAKLVSLVDKRTQREWLAGPGERPLQKVPYGAAFTEQDMSGWDEMFPTIVACAHPGPDEQHGASLPDHGEVWTLPWMLEQAPSDVIKLSVLGRALPYHLSRTLWFSAADRLEMSYLLQNLGQEAMPYIWAPHPQFVSGDEAEILFPPQVKEVINTIPADWGWGEPETRFEWPNATSLDGRLMRIDRTGPPTLEQGRKFFTPPEISASWVGLVRHPERDWLQMEWDSEKIPYLSVWVDEGVLNPLSVVALEPTTGYYDSLAVAWKNKQVTMIEPGETQSWTLTVRLGTREHPFPAGDSMQNPGS